MKNLRTLLSLSVLLLFSLKATADSWSYKPEKTKRVERFGDVRVVASVDGRKERHYPEFAMEIYQKDELVALYKGVDFEQLFPSPDGSVFVGLSNDGLPGTAVIIFDKWGNLRLEVKHGVARFNYCDESVTRVRRWYDSEKPEVKFVPDTQRGGFKEITLRDCKGNTVDLFKTVLKAYDVPFHTRAKRK